MLNFRRITTQKKFIPQIDGLRFVAIASVVLFHFYFALEGRGALRAPILVDPDLPKRGVEVFFAISGFILGVPFASHYILNAPKVRLKQYFLRRLTRLEPPYFLAFPLWMALQWVATGRPISDMVPHLLANAVYIHNLIYGAFLGAVNTVAWSLEIEVQFYTLVPILSLIFAISNPSVRRAVILVAMVAIGLLSNPLYRTTHFRYFIGYYLAFFLAGFLVCDLYITRKEWKIGRICSAVFSNSLITDIGGVCYSIYLLHFPIIYAVKHITAFWHIGSNFWVYCALQACLILPCVLLFCGAFFLLIERPCMDRDWPKKLWNHFHALLVPSAEQPQS